MDVNTLKAVYFIGAGGIGMSALVRYFLSIGKKVAGYDRTPSELTQKLIAEGAAIHYEENVEKMKNIEIEKNWNQGVPATTVHCSDGDVEL